MDWANFCGSEWCDLVQFIFPDFILIVQNTVNFFLVLSLGLSGLEWKYVFSKHLGNSPIWNSFIKSYVQHFPGKKAKIGHLCQIGKTQQVFQIWTLWFFQQRFLKAKIGFAYFGLQYSNWNLIHLAFIKYQEEDFPRIQPNLLPTVFSEFKSISND